MKKSLKIFLIAQALVLVIAGIIAFTIYKPGGVREQASQLQTNIENTKNSEQAITLISSGIPQEVVYNYINNSKMSIETDIFPASNGSEIRITISCDENENHVLDFGNDYDIDWDKSLEYISNAKPYANKPCVYADTLFANLNDENIHETITIPEITLSGQFTANKKAPQSGVSKRKLSDEVKIDFEVNRQDIKLFVLSGDEMKLLDEARESVLQSERASETDLYSSIIMVILPFLPIICLLFYKWIVNQSRGR